MIFKTVVLDSQKYIENNIKEPITADDVAKNAGYSLYYFSRIFKNQVGLSIMEYVKERRMIKASEEIINGKKIIDVALDYCYQSHSGFTKAFSNKFGFSPVFLRAFRYQLKCIGGKNMNHVFINSIDVHATKEELYKILTTTINDNMLKYNLKKILKAYELAYIAHKDKKRYSGDEYVTHPLNVAIILAELEASEEDIIAGLLHDIILEKAELIDCIKEEFSSRVVEIIKGVADFNKNVTDEDVVLVKLADRLHNMRTITFMDEIHWKEKTQETLDIFLPIAKKLNNEKILAELNDLTMKLI